MAAYAISGVLLLAAVMLALRWFVNADPRVAARVLIWIGTIVFAVGVLFLIVTGRLALVFYLLPALLPWLLRIRAVARAAKTFSRMNRTQRGEATGGTSDIETRYLRMRLDHDTGTLWGEVVAGRHNGKTLATMAPADLLDLLAECRAGDPPSAQVLESYLDRHHDGWRVDDPAGPGAAGPGADEGGGQESAGAAAPPSAAMSREEALKVLGLDDGDGAGPDDIKAAHRRLMAALHPDHGGSDYLAAKINQARDVLLGH